MRRLVLGLLANVCVLGCGGSTDGTSFTGGAGQAPSAGAGGTSDGGRGPGGGGGASGKTFGGAGGAVGGFGNVGNVGNAGHGAVSGAGDGGHGALGGSGNGGFGAVGGFAGAAGAGGAGNTGGAGSGGTAGSSGGGGGGVGGAGAFCPAMLPPIDLADIAAPEPLCREGTVCDYDRLNRCLCQVSGFHCVQVDPQCPPLEDHSKPSPGALPPSGEAPLPRPYHWCMHERSLGLFVVASSPSIDVPDGGFRPGPRRAAPRVCSRHDPARTVHPRPSGSRPWSPRYGARLDQDAA